VKTTHGGENRGINLRFGSFYGPASRDSQDMLSMARKGIVMPLATGGTFKSMIWVEDAASAMIAALNHAKSGTFDVAETEPYTQDQAIKALALAVGRRSLFKLPRFLLRFALKPDMRGLLGRSQRITSQEFRDMTGWNCGTKRAAFCVKSPGLTWRVCSSFNTPWRAQKTEPRCPCWHSA